MCFHWFVDTIAKTSEARSGLTHRGATIYRETQVITSMFTFGREHEKECSARKFRGKTQLPDIHFLMTVIDDVHDLIEDKGSIEKVMKSCRAAFTEGGRVAWGQTEHWIRKCSTDYPKILELWSEFADDSRAEIRWRVACLLDIIPISISSELSVKLANDRSKRVSDMALVRIAEQKEKADKQLKEFPEEQSDIKKSWWQFWK
jgi:hypothetical protein